MATRRAVTASNTGAKPPATGTPINTDLGSQVLQKSEVIKSENVSKISQNLIFKIWINNNLDHLIRDYRAKISEFFRNSDLISSSEFRTQKLVFAYFEEKTLNSSDQYLYDTFGEDLIKEIATILLDKLMPKKDE